MPSMRRANEWNQQSTNKLWVLGWNCVYSKRSAVYCRGLWGHQLWYAAHSLQSCTVSASDSEILLTWRRWQSWSNLGQTIMKQPIIFFTKQQVSADLMGYRDEWKLRNKQVALSFYMVAMDYERAIIKYSLFTMLLIKQSIIYQQCPCNNNCQATTK